jgi:hypothetical protein
MCSLKTQRQQREECFILALEWMSLHGIVCLEKPIGLADDDNHRLRKESRTALEVAICNR